MKKTNRLLRLMSLVRFTAVLTFLFVASTQVFAQESQMGIEQQRAPLTNDQMLKQADDAIAQMKADSVAVSKMLETAKREKDTEKMSAVSDKLIQIRSLFSVAQSSQSGLRQQVEVGDRNGVEFEFPKIIIAKEKIAALRAEAEAFKSAASSLPAENPSAQTAGTDGSESVVVTATTGASIGIR